MAIKIIKKTDPTTWRKEVTCSTCKSVLEIGIDDIMKKTDAYEYAYGLEFVCPVCNHTCFLCDDKRPPKEFYYAIKNAD